jgi:hypothetical protein
MLLAMNLGTEALAPVSPACLHRRSRGVARCGAALLASTALLLAARGASADPGPGQAHNFISAGALAGFSGHIESPIVGALGGEVTYTYYPSSAFLFGVGAFVQGQSVGFTHFRAAVGPQFNLWIFGAELGAFIEEGAKADPTMILRSMTFGLHLAPFVSIGFASVALRIGIPLAGLTTGQVYATDIGLIGTIKIPIPLDGSYMDFKF